MCFYISYLDMAIVFFHLVQTCIRFITSSSLFLLIFREEQNQYDYGKGNGKGNPKLYGGYQEVIFPDSSTNSLSDSNHHSHLEEQPNMYIIIYTSIIFIHFLSITSLNTTNTPTYYANDYLSIYFN